MIGGMKFLRDLPAGELDAIQDDYFLSHGQPRILPAKVLRKLPFDAMLHLMVRNGLYVWPTIELIDWLAEHLTQVYGRDQVIEVGAGNGVAAASLGVRATDNMQQSDQFRGYRNSQEKLFWQQARDVYQEMKQAEVVYGPNVLRYDALDAVKRLKPKAAFGLFVTHKYNLSRHQAGGNTFGMNEERILDRLDRYVVVGNLDTHGKKPILNKPHKQIELSGLVTRGLYPSKDRIFVW